jgi:hypothetical protein
VIERASFLAGVSVLRGASLIARNLAISHTESGVKAGYVGDAAIRSVERSSSVIQSQRKQHRWNIWYAGTDAVRDATSDPYPGKQAVAQFKDRGRRHGNIRSLSELLPFSLNTSQNPRSHHDAVVIILCVRPPSYPPLRILYASRHTAIPELRHDQNRVPSSSSIGIHDFAEASLSDLLQGPVAALAYCCDHLPTLWSDIDDQGEGRLDRVRDCGYYSGVELGSVWAEDQGLDG